jgi:Ca-activated chloride channel family protein
VFKLEHPDFLFLLEVLPLVLLAMVWYWYWRRQNLQRLGDEATVMRVMQPLSKRRFWLKNGLLATALALLAMAAANPQRGVRQKTIAERSADVIIAFDVSNSMLAQDVVPSRLELSRIFTRRLIQALEGERIGIVFFAGGAFLQMPLSIDYQAAGMYLRGASPELIEEQGTAIPEAINLAVRSFDANPGAGRAIVLITDGENHDEEAIRHAESAYKDGTILYTVGVGTTEGGTIPLPGGREKRDENNNVVKTALNEDLIRDLAEAGGGKAFFVNQGQAAIDAIAGEIKQLQKRDIEMRSTTDFESFFQFLLLPAIVLLLLEQWIGWRPKNNA